MQIDCVRPIIYRKSIEIIAICIEEPNFCKICCFSCNRIYSHQIEGG